MLAAIYLRDIYTNNSSIGNSDNEQKKLFKMLANLNKDKKLSGKVSFLKNVKILLKAREDKNIQK